MTTINEFLNCDTCSNGICENYVMAYGGLVPLEYHCLYEKEMECLKNFLKNLPEALKILKEASE
jgi:hypothetical protein